MCWLESMYDSRFSEQTQEIVEDKEACVLNGSVGSEELDTT